VISCGPQRQEEPWNHSRSVAADWISESAIEAHRAPDLPVPIDEPVPDPQPGHPHAPDPMEQDDPVPDHKPEVGGLRV
jgi:hypothetical protein